MTFLDSNVFLYAVGGEHELRSPCRVVLADVGAGRLAAITSSEVVQEVLHVLVRRGRRTEGIRLARHVLSLFPDLLEVGAKEMEGATGLLERHPDLGVRDAVHAATMLEAGITTLVSADRHFDAVEELVRLAPGDVPGSSRRR